MGVPPVQKGQAGRPSHFPCGSYLILIPYFIDMAATGKKTQNLRTYSICRMLMASLTPTNKSLNGTQTKNQRGLG